MNSRAPTLIALCSFVAAGCAHAGGTAVSHPKPSPAHVRAPRIASATPRARAVLAAPTPTPKVVAVAPTPPAQIPQRRVPRVPPDAPPRILHVEISSTTVHPGQQVTGSVTTTSNVASVEVRVGGYGMTLKKIGVGRFALTYRVARLAGLMPGTYPLTVIARNTRGDAVERTLPVEVR